MKSVPLLLLAPLLVGAVIAQSNTVAGLNGRLTVIDNLTWWGRRGPAHPNGEIGVSMLNEMCNPGVVELPWFAAMSTDHPKFGFLIARESGGRMVQISNWSYVKHAFLSLNSPSTCGGSCQVPSVGGARMGLNCSDIYSEGNNASQFHLGPPGEVDPWLGTWVAQGSYYDRGDPDVGPPSNNDGLRSLSMSQTSAFDAVKNRVIVQEQDLLVAGARYFYGIHLVHQGEAVANRGDNLASRGFTPVYSSTSGQWTLSNNSVGQVLGSILQHWIGASVSSGGNGTDDGRFFTGVKVTALGGGLHHYEYAVHNVDNHRGGATFRVPVPAASTVTNFSFRDIDSNALNDWSSARVGNEVVFTAPLSNPLNWNSIYNFGFDCTAAPGNGAVILDEARLGAGALSVSVLTTVPGGVPIASNTNVGTGCGGMPCNGNMCYERFATAASFDLANSGLTMTLSGNGYQVGNGTGTYVPVSASSVNLGLVDDQTMQVGLPFAMPIAGGTTSVLWVCSNGFVSTTNNGVADTPAVSGLLAGAYCWYGAWMDLNPAASSGGRVYVDATAAMVRITWNGVYRFNTTSPCTFQLQFLPDGTVHLIWRTMSAAAVTIVGWSIGSGAVDPGTRDISATRAAGWSVCTGGLANLALTATTRPLIGTTVNLVTSNIPAGTGFGAVLLSTQQAIPPINLTSQGMPGCSGYVSGGVTHLFVAPGATSTQPLVIPNSVSFAGLPVIGQSFTYSPPQTPLGIIASNGVLLLVGQL